MNEICKTRCNCDFGIESTTQRSLYIETQVLNNDGNPLNQVKYLCVNFVYVKIYFIFDSCFSKGESAFTKFQLLIG